jgi:phosphatidylserine/phosphatidylglycerophosphate/cardiolipin synthase-like enzyme
MSDDNLLLVPLNQYLVEYEVGGETCFTEIDLTILRAVSNEGIGDLRHLGELLFLPQRLLIESLVGLARSGCVSVNPVKGGFRATEHGRIVLQDPEKHWPEKFATRQCRFLVDQVCGQIAPSRIVTYATTGALIASGDYDRYVRLPRDLGLDRIDIGQVKAILSRGANEWIRWPGEPVLQQEVWLKLHVVEDRIHGLPDGWRSALAERVAAILERPKLARQNPVVVTQTSSQTTSANRGWEVTPGTTGLVFGRHRHSELLRKALADAQSQVLIASAFISSYVIQHDVEPLVVDATRRGVRVDLLWGYSAGTTDEERANTLAALQQLKRKCHGSNLLRFNVEPSGSHAKLLAWDSKEADLHVCIGSFNWLSVPAGSQATDERLLEASVVTTNAGLASDACTTIAGLWGEAESASAGTSDLWHRTASELERHAARLVIAANPISGDGDEPLDMEEAPATTAADSLEPTRGEIRLIRDREHQVLLRQLLQQGVRRVAVVSHKVGGIASVRLATLPALQPAASTAVQVRVVAGEVQADADHLMEELTTTIAAAGGTLHMRSGLHAKVLLVDDAVVISSFNFLSADARGRSADDREVGVLIRSRELCDEVSSWIDSVS